MRTTSTHTPAVSIGMPVYNGEPYLTEAIESILSQTFTDLEMIISDNASDDSTEAICRSFAAKDCRVKYFRNDSNLGAASNFNRVFELASGRYFKWATADDLCATDYLERAVELLDREADVALCYGKTTLIDPAGKIIERYDDGLHLTSKSASGRFLQLKYNMGLCNPVFGVIRREVLKKTKLIGAYIGSDECLLAELSMLGRFWEIPDFLFFRRMHAASSSADKSNEAQLHFFDPKLRGKIVFRHWRHFYENTMAVLRASVPASQKFLPLFFLCGGFVASPSQYLKEIVLAAKQLFSRRRKDSVSCHSGTCDASPLR